MVSKSNPTWLNLCCCIAEHDSIFPKSQLNAALQLGLIVELFSSCWIYIDHLIALVIIINIKSNLVDSLKEWMSNVQRASSALESSYSETISVFKLQECSSINSISLVIWFHCLEYLVHFSVWLLIGTAILVVERKLMMLSL